MLASVRCHVFMSSETMSAACAKAHLKYSSVTFRHYLGLPVILHHFQLVQNTLLPSVDLAHRAAGL